MKLRLPHPLVLLLAGVGVAALLTWVLPPGEYERREDAATGRQVVVPDTYQPVAPSPVDPFRAFVAIPQGFVEAADVIAVVLFVGGAWVVVDRLGTLSRIVGAIVAVFRRRGLLAIPVGSLFFALMGALENMQEEIIALVPVLLLLGRGLGVDAVTVVAMSAGAAMIGSAFGPANPFQAGIAMKLAELPTGSGFALRSAMFVAGVALWILWTMRHARRTRVAQSEHTVELVAGATGKDLLIFFIVLAPMGAYVYGALAWGWGFNELSAGFFIAAMVAGLLGGLGLGGTSSAYLDGMQSMLSAAVLIGVTRAISVVLAEGHVIDTILHALAAPLADVSATMAALLMVPVHAAIHVVVPSVSGHAVLTMPVLVPLSDLLGLSRQVTVLAYQTGAGLTELLTPTNGALMAILLAARVDYDKWVRFAVGGVILAAIVGVIGMMAAR